MNLITDPWFYACAIPAVLLLGISKSGFGVGFGSLAVPLMALSISVPQAAAILMPLLFFTDIMSLKVFQKDVDKSLLRFMLPYGLLGTLLGTALFAWLSVQMVTGLVGLCTLLFLAQRLLFPPKSDAPAPPKWLGRIMITLSGFTSFIAHAGGPPMNVYVIPLKLKPVVFAATLSYFYFFINLSKWIPYAWLGLLDLRNAWTALALIPVAGLGVWIGQTFARHINPKLFYQLVYGGMFLSGAKLLYDGFIVGALR